MKLKVKHAGSIIGGAVGGHPFVNRRNHASGGAYVPIPVHQNVANVYGRRSKASRPAIQAINPKGK